MTTSERQDSTIRYMFGSWEYNKASINIKVTIRDFPRTVTLEVNGITEEFDSGGHWFGDNHLCFFEPYYVRFADDKRLIFGKHQSVVVGDYEWEYTFERI